MNAESAEIFGVWYLDLFQPHGLYFCNAALSKDGNYVRAWNSITNATFDAAIIGLTATQVGILCVKGED
jgi:hypothetical protein